MDGCIFVDRYAYRHDKLRKRFKRLQREGKAVVVEQDQRGWYYKLIEEKKERKC